MIHNRHLKFLLLFFLFLIVCSGIFAQVRITKPVCEYKVNPIGIDVKKPRLSWQLITDGQNAMQTAYEIRMADSPKNLSNKSKQIWSTGKVTGGESVNIEYEGPELESMQQVYWQVRVWDNTGEVSNWSEPAYWEMGILDPQQWTASWISMPISEATSIRPHLKWKLTRYDCTYSLILPHSRYLEIVERPFSQI